MPGNRNGLARTARSSREAGIQGTSPMDMNLIATYWNATKWRIRR